VGDHPVKVPLRVMHDWLAGWHQDQRAAEGLLAQAAQWGADQELEAICETITGRGWPKLAADFRTARRPKPPTLAEQALHAAAIELDPAGRNGSVIMAALNRLAELEAKQ
jgi:hypothetical protein